MSCAFKPCAEVKTCALVGGCIEQRFGKQQRQEQPKLTKAKALNGTKPKRGKPRG